MSFILAIQWFFLSSLQYFSDCKCNRQAAIRSVKTADHFIITAFLAMNDNK